MGKSKLRKYCDEFLATVRAAIQDHSDDKIINAAIEKAYNAHIFEKEGGPTKAQLLGYLYSKDAPIFTRVVNHLFTPMAWSELKIQKYYGIENTTTGRLVTLMRNESNESKDMGADFLLVECIDQPDLSPMLVRDEAAAEKFIAILNRPSTSASYDSSTPPETDSESSYSDDRVVHLDLDDNINTGNLEVVEVELLFK